MEPDALNPYRSPQTPITPAWPILGDPQAPWNARRVRAAWRQRHIRIEGPIEAELEWDAVAVRETIRINRRRVASKCPLWYAPRFEFTLETQDGSYEVVVEISLSLWVERVNLFRILVNGETIYEEKT